MANVAFTAYPFTALDAPTTRTLPARLREIVNVKDWGAVGDGIADDHAAIQNAIHYAGSLGAAYPNNGAIVFIPPGTYRIGHPSGVQTRLAVQGNIVGAGRSATILRGNFSTGEINPWPNPSENPNVLPPLGNPSYLVSCFDAQITMLADLTIWNESTEEGSGAFFASELDERVEIRNVRFIGTVGCAFPQAAYGICIRDCRFTCSIPTPRADAAVRDNPFTTVGLYPGQGQVVNCWIEGFSTGIYIWGQGELHGNTVYRCSTGIVIGTTISPGVDGLATPWICNGYNIFSNRIIGCYTAIYTQVCSGVVVAGNVISSGTGRYGDATIAGMIKVTLSVIVTTQNPHHLSVGDKVKLNGVPTWLPDGNTDGIVTINTVSDAVTFTYTGPTSTPSPFTSGTWNYASMYGIRVQVATNLVMIANVFMDIVGPDIAPQSGFGQQEDTLCMSMNIPHGATQTSDGSRSSWRFINCWTPGQATPSIIPYAELPGPDVITKAREGDEWTISNGFPNSASFGAVISGGGTNHYKVRYTGPDYSGGNWIRVG
jgi:hypothetical protein